MEVKTPQNLLILFLGDISHPNSQNWISALEKYGGCKIIPWSLPINGSKCIRAVNWLFSIYQIKAISKKLEPDIVIGYRITSYGYLVSKIKKCPKIIAAQGESDVWPPYGFVSKLVSILARNAIKHADLIHAWGPHMADSMFKLGAREQKVWIMPRGIDLEVFSFPKSNCDFSFLRVVVTRTIGPEYGHHIIIDAIKTLSERKIPVLLTIVGDGSLKKDIEKKVIESGLSDRVTFTGRLERNELVRVLQKSNVYVSMPITEGVSSSLFEAMACGCIPCVSDLKANQYWIKNGENGFLIPTDNNEELANAMLNIYNEPKKFLMALRNNRNLVEQNASAKDNTIRMVNKYREIIQSYKN